MHTAIQGLIIDVCAPKAIVGVLETVVGGLTNELDGLTREPTVFKVEFGQYLQEFRKGCVSPPPSPVLTEAGVVFHEVPAWANKGANASIVPHHGGFDIPFFFP